MRLRPPRTSLCDTLCPYTTLCRAAVPAFELLARRYLAPEYAPEAVAERCGIPAATIRRIAAELAEAAFEKEVVLDIPWTDLAGRRHDKMIGRPVAMHARSDKPRVGNEWVRTCRSRWSR